MALELHQWTAIAYLAAAAAAVLAHALAQPRIQRLGLVLLGVGVFLHSGGLFQLHRLDPAPQLTDLPFAVSLMAWCLTWIFLLTLVFVRSGGLLLLVAPAAFLGAFWASVAGPGPASEAAAGSPIWSHAHVLLASGGFAALGVAGAAGVLYVANARRLKDKRRAMKPSGLPSLEACDRVNGAALGVGFLLTTLSVMTGVLWVNETFGTFFAGGLHAIASLVAWAFYAVVLAERHWLESGARRSALHSAAGFVVMGAAVVGVGLLS